MEALYLLEEEVIHREKVFRKRNCFHTVEFAPLLICPISIFQRPRIDFISYQWSTMESSVLVLEIIALDSHAQKL